MKPKYNNIILPIPKKSIDINSKMGDNVQVVSKNVEIPQEVVNAMMGIKNNAEAEFNPNLNAYVPFYNEKTKKYEMFTVAIDTETNRMELFRKILPHDNENRAIMEMQKMYADDFLKRIKAKRDEEQNIEREKSKNV